MVVRYFDIPPSAEAFGYGIISLTQRQKQLQEEAKARTEERERRQKKTGVMIGGAALGGLGGLALAPAAGVAAAGGGALHGAVGAAPVLGTGTLASGLIGASIGARAGGQFFEGDVAGGLGTIAEPFLQQEARQYAEGLREADLGREMRLDEYRTDQDIRRAREVSTLRDTGMTASELDELDAARTQYQTLQTTGPEAGEDLGLPSPYVPREAFGPLGEAPVGSPPGPAPTSNLPGPSTVPGMEKIWTAKQYNELSRLEQRRLDTVDNANWVASHTPQQRAAEYASLARAREAIRPTLVPSAPKPMNIGPDGTLVPMQLGANPSPDGGTTYWMGGESIRHVPPPKAQSETEPPIRVVNPDGTITEYQGDIVEVSEGVYAVRKGFTLDRAEEETIGMTDREYKDIVKSLQTFDDAGNPLPIEDRKILDEFIRRRRLRAESVDALQDALQAAKEEEQRADEAAVLVQEAQELGRMDNLGQLSLPQIDDWVRKLVEQYGDVERSALPKSVRVQFDALTRIAERLDPPSPEVPPVSFEDIQPRYSTGIQGD